MDRILVTRSSMPSMEEYIEEIKELWETHWLTNMGVKHKRLQQELKEYLGVSNVELLTNGHMALELTMQAMNLHGEVITTPFTFASTTHALVRNGLTPVFCDINPADFTMDVSKIESLITDKTCAIVPVHVYGNICDVKEIERIAHKYGLKVIYDAAHAFGETYEGRGIGSFGDASCFSFHATKVFNTIEGGAVTFSDHRIYEKLYNLKNFGIRGEELVTEVGANAKMNEFCAIMGLCNLKRINNTISARKHVVDHYTERLKGIEGVIRFEGNDKGTESFGYYPILITDQYKCDRNEVYDKLKRNGVYARKYFFPVTSDQACFKNRYRYTDIPNARLLAEQVLTLPLYEDLSDEEIDMIVDLL